VPCTEACDGCALTKDAAANKEVQNHVKATLTVLAPFPFYCHENMDWENNLSHMLPSKALKALGQLTPCKGWMREVKALAETGYYKEDARFTRQAGVAALNYLNQLLATKPGEQRHEEARKWLWDFYSHLIQKRKKFLKLRKEILNGQEANQ
jgi:hypothetical protein